MVAVVAVQKHHDIRGISGEMRQCAQACRTVATLRLEHDLRAVFPGHLRSGVGRTIVGDDDSSHRGTGDLPKDAGQSLLLVERRNDDVDLHPGVDYRRFE